MDAVRNRVQTASARAWTSRIKDQAYRKIAASPLVKGCVARGNADRHALALLAGFWPFVDVFPAIIRDTYADALADTRHAVLRRFQQRAGPFLAGTLDSMADDERDHRALWLRAARSLGLSADDLARWPVLPEVRELITAIGEERELGRRLLYFVGVEIVAESTARVLSQAPRFVETMGKEGMRWFAVHLVAPGQLGAHEALAYRLALAVRRAAGQPVDEAVVAADIQRCVGWFVVAGAASVASFCPGAGAQLEGRHRG